MLLKYNTFNSCGEEEIVEKKSRFIGYSSYISTEEEALAFINQIKKTNYNASHSVFAYRLDAPVILERQSDDGEPSGTAGMPILDIMRGNDLINAIVVVTRYFGGVLLGTGGLVRAYSKAAKEVIKETGIIEKVLYQLINVKVDYNLSGKVQYEIFQKGIIIKDTLYTDMVEYIAYVEAGKEEGFIKAMGDITSGTALINMGEKLYGANINGEFKELNYVG